MLKFKELEPMVEYYEFYESGTKGKYKVRKTEDDIIEKCFPNGWGNCGVYHNILMEYTFEPCEWVPKINEKYYIPDFDGCGDSDFYLSSMDFWVANEIDLRRKRNIGIYRTAKEAHAKSLEMGWTL